MNQRRRLDQSRSRLALLRYHDESLMRLAQECRRAGQWSEHSVLVIVALDDDVGRGLIRDLGVAPTPAPVKRDEIPTALGICDARLLAVLLKEVQPNVASQVLLPLPRDMTYILAVAFHGARSWSAVSAR